MSERFRVQMAQAMGMIAVVGSIGGLIWVVLLGRADELWQNWIFHNGIIALGAGVIAWTVAPRQPDNSVTWVFGWAGLFTGLECLTYAIGAQALTNLGRTEAVLDVVPATVPPALAVLLMFTNFLWVGVFFPFTFGLALFPDGRLPSRKWRPILWVLALFFTMQSIGLFWEARPSSVRTLRAVQDTNGGFETLGSSLVTIGYPAVFAVVPFCVAALIVRFRKSRGVERQQFRWVAWGASVAGAAMVSAVILDEVTNRLDLALVAGAFAMAVLLASFGIAITKYRLYDVDVVISRSVVYGALAVFITASYVAVVVGVGQLIQVDSNSPILAIAATGLVAAAVQPVRRRMQRVANRIAYGRRATPYEVLSDFSRRVSGTDVTVLDDVARLLVEGTSASQATVWVISGGNRHQAASWPDSPSSNNVESVVDHPVIHEDEELGAITLGLQPGQRLDPTDLSLVTEVASGLGLALRNLRLTEVLRSQVKELRASRRRIVEVRDATRRSLERDLHDGAQQQLVALKVKLGLARRIAEQEDASLVGPVDTIAAEADDAISAMRTFARGLYPPLLAAEGLGPALSAHVRTHGLPVAIDDPGVGRLDEYTEATLFFSAVDLTAKLANGGRVLLWAENGIVGFDLVADDDLADHDLSEVIDRVGAADGTVEQRPGTIMIRVPFGMAVT